MSDEGNSTKPYRLLGRRLRSLREDAKESVAEVSGAVEIDSELLEKFELGLSRPTRDILLLLISHFEMPDDQADELWDTAGYERLDEVPETPKSVQTLVLAPDTRIIYTDMVQVDVNPYGLVLSFGQEPNSSSQPQLISRLGMSLEQAKKVIATMQASLEQATPKTLPAVTSRISKKPVQEKSDQP